MTTHRHRPTALGLFAAALLLLAAAAGADRACTEDPAVSGRTCSEVTCLSLQAAVNDACKNQQIFSCRRLNTCPALIEMRSRWTQCASARDRINGTCWRGGDPGHTQASIQAWQNVGTCNARIAQRCDNCPWDDIPGLFAPVQADPRRTAPAGAAGSGADPLAAAVERLAAEGELLALLAGAAGAVGEPEETGGADGGPDGAVERREP